MDDGPHERWGLQTVRLTDQAIIGAYLQSLSEPLSDYTFSQIYTWGNSLRIFWKEIRGHLCIFANGTGDLTLLMPPIGDGGSEAAMGEAFELMDDYNQAHGAPCGRSRVEYTSEELLARFDRSRLRVDPLAQDYVYDVRRMIELDGGDLASKRQAKNRFLRNYPHRVEDFDPARHLDPCLRLLQEWKQHQDAQHIQEDSTNAIKRQKETLACELALRDAASLGFKGMVVYVKEPGVNGASQPSGDDGWSLRAFTFGEALGRDQSSIIIEKTDLSIKGLAQFIFSEFCRRHWAYRPLVNVGDDWGLPSLAWTKMSYRPVRLLQKYVLHRAQPVKVAISQGLGSGVAASASRPVADVVPAAGATLVRKATKADLAAAVELEQTCFSAYSLTKRRLQYLQQRPNAVFLVAEQKGRVVGEGISLVRHHKHALSGRVYSLAVRQECRGQKIGPQLLRQMVADLMVRGVKRIYLEVEQENRSAIRLYERHGFRSIGVLPDYYGQGRSGLHMMYEVAPEARSGPVMSESRA